MTIRKLFLVLSLFMSAPALADTIAIIGTGDVGMALGTEFARQGHTIVYGSRSPLGLKALDLAKKTDGKASTATPADAAAGAEIIVLAVHQPKICRRFLWNVCRRTSKASNYT